MPRYLIICEAIFSNTQNSPDPATVQLQQKLVVVLTQLPRLQQSGELNVSRRPVAARAFASSRSVAAERTPPLRLAKPEEHAVVLVETGVVARVARVELVARRALVALALREKATVVQLLLVYR